ncbi:integrase [Aquipseudomonas alcaligenes]|uniref:integrase n=1 Tax=Aquipseudomonas alcaligenes TaxID=43263 RepID=UPI003656504C
MSDIALEDPLSNQPSDVCGLPEPERNCLVISTAKVDGQYIILSRYGDDIWKLTGFTNNTSVSQRLIDFNAMPSVFMETIKAVFYRYLRRGRAGKKRPKGGAVRRLFGDLIIFLRYMQTLGIDNLGAVTPEICNSYITFCKARRTSAGKPLAQGSLNIRLSAIEALHELSQYTEDPILQHPWAETSAMSIAGLTGSGALHKNGSKTPLIPDEVYCSLFDRAYQQVERGRQLLDMRDALDALTRKFRGKNNCRAAKRVLLKDLDWGEGLPEFNKALIDLRTACYIVLASTSGCRDHELCNLNSGALHRTEDDDGNIYHWMRSRSDKTEKGYHDWMIPEAAVRALRIMERWAVPYQSIIAADIERLRRSNPFDPRIAEAQRHRNSLFLGVYLKDDMRVRTLSNMSTNLNLRKFIKGCGLKWRLTSHQFRRKFASYVAHSCFGDLRYLKEHYAHWSLDMVLHYAMDDSWGAQLDHELYIEIQQELDDIKLGAVDAWVSEELLGGGYGRDIKQWQRDPQNLLIFKDHSSMLKSIAESTAIRSNGHAWCTADNDGCVGNSFESTRCGNCNNAVIGARHASIYQRLYDELKGLLHCSDIGEGGRQRVERDLNRCRDVLIDLGVTPELLIA